MSVTRADLITRLRNPAHSTAETQNTILHTGTACADMREAAAKIESDAKVIATQDELLAKAADMLNVSERMMHMDLGSEITEYRRKFLATGEQTAGESK